MIITKEAINHIEKTETKFNKLAAAASLGSIVSIIVLILSMCAASETDMSGGEVVCIYVSIGCLILFLFASCAILSVRDKLMLDIVNLEQGQTLYEISYTCLEVIPVVVNRIDTDDKSRLISVDEMCLRPKHESLYLEEDVAQNALNKFLEELYKNVSDYVGYDGTVSAEDRANFRIGYMDYLSSKDPADPTDYDLAEVVKAIAEYCESKEYRKAEYDRAVEVLRNRLTIKK